MSMSRVVCVICARSGSKGVADKNIRLLQGKPLLAHSVEVAVQSNLFDEVVVTSDSDAYLNIAREYGAGLLVERPADLAADTTTKLGAIEHAVLYAEDRIGSSFDVIVDLDVTSPLRTQEDLSGCLELFKTSSAKSVITGCVSHRSPYTNLVERGEDGVVNVVKPVEVSLSRRQEAPVCFDMNASIYIWDRVAFREDPKVFYDDTLLYEMPFDRSWDIDYEIDFEIVELMMSRRK